MQQIIELIGFILSGEETVEPSCDVYEKDNLLYIDLEIPGLDEEHLKVEIYSEGVQITGIKRKRALEDVRYLRAERMFGHFRRFIELPCCIGRVEKIGYSKGILTVILSKR